MMLTVECGEGSCRVWQGVDVKMCLSLLSSDNLVCLRIGWYFWNNLLCFRRHKPYGIDDKIVPSILPHLRSILKSSLRWKGCDTYSLFQLTRIPVPAFVGYGTVNRTQGVPSGKSRDTPLPPIMTRPNASSPDLVNQTGTTSMRKS